MPTSLDDIRARFGADKPAPKPSPEVVAAISRLKKGRCPSCDQPTFKNLMCKSCGFNANQKLQDLGPDEELPASVLAAVQKSPGDPVDKDDAYMARIAMQAAHYLVTAPEAVEEEIKETMSSTEHLAELEADIAKQTALRSRARAIRQHVGEGGKGGRFTVETSEDGGARDAILQFGQFKGQRVSDMRLQSESARYLRWILDEQFNPVLKEIIREQLGLPQVQDDE